MGEDYDNLMDMLLDCELDEGLCDDCNDCAITSNKELLDATTNTSVTTQGDIGIQNVAVMLDSCTVVKGDAEVQAVVTTEEAGTDINPRLLCTNSI